MKLFLAVCLLLLINAATLQAQQTDTSMVCGFSRIDWSHMYRWFSPAAARTLRVAMLRSKPSTQSAALKKIPAGTLIYIVSDAPQTTWYQAIEQATGKVGWVDGGALQLESEVTVDSTTAAAGYDGSLKQLQSAAPSGKNSKGQQDTSARLRIVNHYQVPLTLLLDGKKHTVPRALVSKTSVLNLKVKSGRQGYVIVVPDPEIVDVFFGFAELRPGCSYEYDKEIQSIE